MKTIAETGEHDGYDGALKVWSTEGGETCISTSAAEAANHYEKAIGDRVGKDGEPAGGDVPGAEWAKERADKVLRFKNEDGSITVRTCGEWAESDPVGYFGSWN